MGGYGGLLAGDNVRKLQGIGHGFLEGRLQHHLGGRGQGPWNWQERFGIRIIPGVPLGIDVIGDGTSGLCVSMAKHSEPYLLVLVGHILVPDGIIEPS